MAEAVVQNLDALVTKDYLDQVLDARFAKQESNFQEWRSDVRGEFRLVHVMQALLVAGVFLPQLRALLG